MRLLRVAFVAAAFIVTPIHDAIAQSPEMPIPNLVVKDADGKVMAQVNSFYSVNFNPVVVFNFDGVPAPFYLEIQHGMFRSFKTVYFQNIDCTGDVYITAPSNQAPLDILFQTSFAITGPDQFTGAYRVYRSTSPVGTPTIVSSKWNQSEDSAFLGYCDKLFGHVFTVAPAEEILPNPFDGFHGPTEANPERMLTIEGGTKLP